jgi:hypothetical protein
MTPSPFDPNLFNAKNAAPPERLLGKKIPLIDRTQIPLHSPLHPPATPEALQALDPMLRRVLGRMPADVAQSLSDRQLNALNKAIATPSQHSLDIRKTVPFFFQRFYIILLAGPEQRSPERLQQSQRPWSSTSTAIFTLLALGLGLMLYQVGCRSFLAPPTPKPIAGQTEKPHPTALPWIESKAACKGANRSWRDGLCYDSSHQPEFRR